MNAWNQLRAVRRLSNLWAVDKKHFLPQAPVVEVRRPSSCDKSSPCLSAVLSVHRSLQVSSQVETLPPSDVVCYSPHHLRVYLPLPWTLCTLAGPTKYTREFMAKSVWNKRWIPWQRDRKPSWLKSHIIAQDWVEQLFTHSTKWSMNPSFSTRLWTRVSVILSLYSYWTIVSMLSLWTEVVTMFFLLLLLSRVWTKIIQQGPSGQTPLHVIIVALGFVFYLQMCCTSSMEPGSHKCQPKALPYIQVIAIFWAKKFST